MYGIALYCKETYGGVSLSDSNTTPSKTTLLCSSLDCGNIYEIVLYCKGTLVVVGLWDSNTTPGYTTLLYSALDCGHIYGIALYCKDTNGGGLVVWDFPIVIPLQVRKLYSALPWIVAIHTIPSAGLSSLLIEALPELGTRQPKFDSKICQSVFGPYTPI